MKILYRHGWNSVVGGVKPTFLKTHGHEVIEPALDHENFEAAKQVLVYIADEHDGPVLNELWDAWVPAEHPPVRAMVQVGLGEACKIEMVVTAAVPKA
jgi:enamine deaminase RidA (YjgF/YER057c/UK114 family)